MEQTKKKFKEFHEKRGITLVALVITIIIIIILATVTINMAFGDNGLITQAELARDLTINSTQYEEESIANLTAYMNEMTSGTGEGSGSEEGNMPSTVEEAKESGTVFTEKTTITDEKGNEITIPGGFKIADDSGDTVKEGIVIEDVSASTDENVQGSQYVWIPVGTFIKDDGTTSAEIVLGRYTFSTSDGTTTLQQSAANYAESVVISSYYSELATYREGVASSVADGLNATAYSLAGFINSVNENGGYYIGRYEASYASGSSVENYKAASKISTGYSTSSMSYSVGTLWNSITQINASKVAINTYAESTSVKSDLTNSYAWDTAIVYIQEAGNSNYANQTSKNSSLANTGENGDEVCKINDMASNVREWTTEYSSIAFGNTAGPCVDRGGYYNGSRHYTALRDYNVAAVSYNYIGFRLSLYM